MVSPAWAIPTPGILLCVAVNGPVSYEWSCAFANLWATHPPGIARFKLPPYVIDRAREIGAETALGQNFKWLFFLDSDVIAPPDTIQRLIAHNKPIVSGLYARRHPPFYPLLLKRTSENPIKLELIADYPPGQLVEVDAAPAGCLLVATSALRSIPRPWFEWTEGRAIDGLSEDYAFTMKAQRAGFRTYVDTSLKCLHEGEIDVGVGEGGSVNFLAKNPNP